MTLERQVARIQKRLLIKAEGQTCIMADMSKNGMRLIIPNLLKKQQVDITFQMDDVTLELRGIIRWIKKEPTVYDLAQYQVGIHLLDPPGEYVQLVDKLLKKE